MPKKVFRRSFVVGVLKQTRNKMRFSQCPFFAVMFFLLFWRICLLDNFFLDNLFFGWPVFWTHIFGPFVSGMICFWKICFFNYLFFGGDLFFWRPVGSLTVWRKVALLLHLLPSSFTSSHPPFSYHSSCTDMSDIIARILYLLFSHYLGNIVYRWYQGIIVIFCTTGPWPAFGRRA